MPASKAQWLVEGDVVVEELADRQQLSVLAAFWTVGKDERRFIGVVVPAIMRRLNAECDLVMTHDGAGNRLRFEELWASLLPGEAFSPLTLTPR